MWLDRPTSDNVSVCWTMQRDRIMHDFACILEYRQESRRVHPNQEIHCEDERRAGDMVLPHVSRGRVEPQRKIAGHQVVA